MRNFSTNLGVRCQFCHVGREGQPLTEFNFITDEKRTKLVARQMMLMVADINRRLDSIPGKPANALTVTCNTCHRGVSRPIPLAALVAETADGAGADSAVRAYKQLREQYYGRDSYDFGENSLNNAAFRLGNGKRYAEALAVLKLNEEYYPGSSTASLFRGNVILLQGDTTSAAASFMEALRRDPQNAAARDRLKAIGRSPSTSSRTDLRRQIR